MKKITFIPQKVEANVVEASKGLAKTAKVVKASMNLAGTTNAKSLEGHLSPIERFLSTDFRTANTKKIEIFPAYDVNQSYAASHGQNLDIIVK